MKAELYQGLSIEGDFHKLFGYDVFNIATVAFLRSLMAGLLLAAGPSICLCELGERGELFCFFIACVFLSVGLTIW